MRLIRNLGHAVREWYGSKIARAKKSGESDPVRRYVEGIKGVGGGPSGETVRLRQTDAYQRRRWRDSMSIKSSRTQTLT